MRSYFVETWGCQMNVLDSQYLAGMLEARGLVAAAAATEADLVLLNTCSVRDKAVQKVMSRLGELQGAREQGGRPQVVGLCGCVAEQEGERLLGRGAAVSFVLGPGRLGQLGAALDSVLDGERRVLTGFSPSRDIDSHLVVRHSGVRQFVTVIHGCNQHCTFCVVPYTRGREHSRPVTELVEEVLQLVDGGAREITLLGQTVNAYSCPETGADFAELISTLGDIAGDWRLQFLTSHPKYFTNKLIESMAKLDRMGSYLHLPYQSGSTAILKKMHRRYTREEYLDLVSRIKAELPRVNLSTDVIVGFPGETEDDFLETLSMAEEVRFGQLFGFIYSPRPRTPAARYEGRVPRNVASDRLQRLFASQQAIQLELNQDLIGTTVEVLVDGPAKRGSGMWQGRGADNRVVNFPGWEGISAGVSATLRITGATAHALLGEPPSLPSARLA